MCCGAAIFGFGHRRWIEELTFNTVDRRRQKSKTTRIETDVGPAAVVHPQKENWTALMILV